MILQNRYCPICRLLRCCHRGKETAHDDRFYIFLHTRIPYYKEKTFASGYFSFINIHIIDYFQVINYILRTISQHRRYVLILFKHEHLSASMY